VTVPVLEEAGDRQPTDPQPAPPLRATRAPAWLWIAAVLVLIPVAIPLAFLFADVIGATESAREVLFDTRTLELLIRSVVFTAAVTFSAVAIGLAAAWLTVRVDLRAPAAWTVLIALPLVIPSYVIALTIISFNGPRGLFAEATGLALPAVSGFWGAWLALTLSTYPYVFIIARATLRRIDPALEEAARGLGASGWKTWRTVTLPQLRPAIGAGGLLVALYTLSDFGAVSLMRFDTFTRVIYAQYQGRIDRTPAAVLSVVLILLVLVIVYFEGRSRGRGVYFTRRPSPDPGLLHPTPNQSIFVYGSLGGLVIAALVLPSLVLLAWLARGISRGSDLEIPWGAIAGSLSGSTAAALLAMLAALPVIILTVRYRSRLSAWLDRSVYVVFSLPHITVALAVVFFGATYLGPLYQSFAILVIVYAVLFLAQATGPGGAALLQVNPHLEQASRGLGKTTEATIRRITLPLMWRGLLAGGLLVWLTTMKELPATLLLRPTGFTTLAVRIWSSANELLYAQAAVAALILIVVSALPMYLVVIRLQGQGR
jgi:iron(III) transport system permease protein